MASEDDDIVEMEEGERVLDKVSQLTMEDRANVRESYKGLTSLARDISTGGSAKADINSIITGIQDSTAVFQSGHVLLPSEATYDAEVLKQFSEIIRHKILTTKDAIVEFDSNDYATQLTACLKTLHRDKKDKTDEFATLAQWAELGEMTGAAFRRAPAFHCMYGCFKIEKPNNEGVQNQSTQGVTGQIVGSERQGDLTQTTPAQKKKDRPKLKNEIHPVTQPKALTTTAEIDESEETTKTVDFVWRTLKAIFEKNNGQPISYYEFVLDPNSFVQSVENMFYVSFLVKNGKIGIGLNNENGLPTLTVHDTTNTSGPPAMEQSGVFNQCIITIDFETWKDLVETFEVKEAVLKFTR